MQFLKPKYPDKQTINLALKETDKISVRNQLIAFGLFLICLGIFVKFGVIGRLEAVEQAKLTYLETQQYIESLEEYVQKYSEINKLYGRLNNTFLSDSEKQEIDRIEIISLIEECVMQRADIQKITITGNEIIISVMDTTLATVSDIVAALENNKKTAYVTVFTAGTNSQEKQDGTVTADIMIQLKQEVKGHE